MLNLKNELREHIDKYFSAATHATRYIFQFIMYHQVHFPTSKSNVFV